MKNILSHLQSWAQVKWFLIILGGTITLVVPTAIVGSKKYVTYQLSQNTEEVNLNSTLDDLKTGQEDAATVACVTSNKVDSILSLINKIENKVESNTIQNESLKRLMNYERKHRDEYSKEQMDDQLKEFEELLKKNGTAQEMPWQTDYVSITTSVNRTQSLSPL